MSMRISIWTVSFVISMPAVETALGELGVVDAVELGITMPGAILILDDIPGIFSIVAALSKFVSLRRW
jgi:hypothetical protein